MRRSILVGADERGVNDIVGDIIAPASNMEIKGVWVMQPGAASDGSQDAELGSLTGTVSGSVATFQLAAADYSSSPGGTRFKSPMAQTVLIK